MIAGTLVEAVLDSGDAPDPADPSGALTRAGRALQKHGDRPGSIFPPVKGNPSSINLQGRKVLRCILDDPAAAVEVGNRFGGFDVTAPSGAGARFDVDGVFRGFLEPKQ